MFEAARSRTHRGEEPADADEDDDRPDDAATVGELLREIGQGRATPEELRDAAIYWSAAIDPDMECADLQTIAWLLRDASAHRRVRPPTATEPATGPPTWRADGQLTRGPSEVGAPRTASLPPAATPLLPARPVPTTRSRGAGAPAPTVHCAQPAARGPPPASHPVHGLRTGRRGGPGPPPLRAPAARLRWCAEGAGGGGGSGASVMARTTTIRVAPAAVTWSGCRRRCRPMANQGWGGRGRRRLDQRGAGGGAAGFGGRCPDGAGDQVVPGLGGGAGAWSGSWVERRGGRPSPRMRRAHPSAGRPGRGGARRPGGQGDVGAVVDREQGTVPAGGRAARPTPPAAARPRPACRGAGSGPRPRPGPASANSASRAGSACTHTAGTPPPPPPPVRPTAPAHPARRAAGAAPSGRGCPRRAVREVGHALGGVEASA
jgi:hypothetical protein